MGSFSRIRRFPVLLFICLLHSFHHDGVAAWVPPLPSRRIRTLYHQNDHSAGSRPTCHASPLPRNDHKVLVTPQNVKADATKEEESKSSPIIVRFFKNLATGILFAKPMKPSFTEALFRIRGKRKNDKESPTSPSVSFTLRECILSIGVYLLLGIFAYSIMMEHWSLVDAVYFSITTFTTVGYGDEFPHTTFSKMFTCLFSLGGIAFLGAALASIGATLVDAEVKAVNTARRLSRKRVLTLYDRMPRILKRNNETAAAANSNVTAVVKFDDTSVVRTGDSVPPKAEKTVRGTTKSVVWKLVPSFALLLMGGVAIGRLEGWAWVDSIYYAIITAGTVGLGDYSPQRQVTRLCAILFIPLAVAAGGEILGTVAAAFLERRRVQVYHELIGKDLTMHHIKEMDKNGDGEVSRLEYMEFMLVEMKLVEPSVLAELNEQFDRLDMTMSDSLTKDDLIAMAKLRRSLEEQPSLGSNNTSDVVLDVNSTSVSGGPLS